MDNRELLQKITSILINDDYYCCGYEALDFSIAGVKQPTVPDKAMYMEIRIESSDVTGAIIGRYLNLGTTTLPTSTAGMAVANMDYFDVTGSDAVNRFRIIQVIGGTHIAHIQYLRHAFK